MISASDVIIIITTATTLLKIILGLEEADGGQVTFIRGTRVGYLPRFGCSDQTGPAGGGDLSRTPLVPSVPNYYQTDAISRSSPTMAACTQAHAGAPALAAE